MNVSVTVVLCDDNVGGLFVYINNVSLGHKELCGSARSESHSLSDDMCRTYGEVSGCKHGL